MKSNYLNKARELGKAIVESDEYVNLKKCEDALYSDSESVERYENYRSLENKGDESADKMLQDEKVREYVSAQKAYNAMMSDINVILSYFTGHTSEKGSCGGCGGCRQ